LFGDEHRFTNAPNLGDILLPVRDTYVILFIGKPRLPCLTSSHSRSRPSSSASHSPRLSMCSASAAHQLQQLAQFARQVAALAAGEQQQVVVDFGPGQACAWVATRTRRLAGC
jgi:hypothetical protein